MKNFIPKIHHKSSNISLIIDKNISKSDIKFSMIRRKTHHALVITTPTSQDVFPLPIGKNDNMRYNLENSVLTVTNVA